MKFHDEKERAVVLEALSLLASDYFHCIEGRKGANPDRTETDRSIKDYEKEYDYIQKLRMELNDKMECPKCGESEHLNLHGDIIDCEMCDNRFHYWEVKSNWSDVT